MTLPVRCRVRGHDSSGRVHDLSREACLLDSANGYVAAGDYVMLQFESGLRVRGRATLLHGRIARIEFEHPLHEAICAHLLNRAEGPAASRRSDVGSATRRLA